MVRSFTVKQLKDSDKQYIGKMLDDKLLNLQENGWRIISVHSFNFALWDYPKTYDAMGFVIVADDDKFI